MDQCTFTSMKYTLKILVINQTTPHPKIFHPKQKILYFPFKKIQKKEKFLILTKETDFSRSKNKFLILF